MRLGGDKEHKPEVRARAVGGGPQGWGSTKEAGACRARPLGGGRKLGRAGNGNPAGEGFTCQAEKPLILGKKELQKDFEQG